jgi:prephenate dehydrogenase
LPVRAQGNASGTIGIHGVELRLDPPASPPAGVMINLAQPTVGILGLGSFGRFWARWLGTRFEVVTYDPDRTRGSSCESEEALFGKADAVFLCVPIRVTEEVVRKAAAFVRPGQLVADVCSVKVKPVAWMLANLPEHCRILATHPMFGAHSAAESLADHNLMLHPVRCASNEYAWLVAFLRDHGVRVTEMTPDEHDRIAAHSQGVSFFVGQILGRMQLRETPIDTRGYRTLLRMVEQTTGDRDQLFEDMMRFNPYARAMRDQFLAEATRLKAELDDSTRG